MVAGHLSEHHGPNRYGSLKSRGFFLEHKAENMFLLFFSSFEGSVGSCSSEEQGEP